jgi:hypothetical protein
MFWVTVSGGHQVESLKDEPDPLAPQDRQAPLA